MSNKPDNPLRAEALAKLADSPPMQVSNRSAGELLHELQVYQIELEMQNDELRRAQIALEESRDRYVDLYEFAPVGYLTLNRYGMIAKVNLTGAALLGMERKKLLNRRFAGFVASEDRNRWHSHFLNTLQRDGHHNCELALQNGDGSRIHARMDCLRMGTDSESSVHITLTDITEHKRAEEILRISRNQLKTFIQHAPISIAMFDRKMNYVTTSGRWIEEYGRGYSDLTGRNHYEVHPDVPAMWKDVHQQALGGATLENKDDMWVQSDGSKHWLRWAALPWTDESAEIGGIIISTEDLTDRKNMEMEISERRNEMECLQRKHVAAQTAAAIAHELNQPLLAIAAYSEAALMMIKAEKPNFDKISKAIEGSVGQSLRAGQSIRKMLEFLSLKEFPTEVFDLNKEIHDALNAAHSEYELRFNPVLHLEKELPFIRANRIHVHKVLLNLLRNSVDAMQEAHVPLPEITVTLCIIKDANVAQVTIQDNGPGVKKEDFNQLFEPFFTTKTQGIGMGLAISRELIVQNGGQLWVDPKEGSGATFHLTLPFAS